MTHIPFQPWCVVCQEAKGRASQHRKQRASTKTSRIQLDYAYIRQPQDKEPTTILTWVESLTGLAGSLMTAKKGVTQAQLDAVITFIKRQGFSQSTLQCDGEPALVKLVEEIGKQTSLPTRQSKDGTAACLHSFELCFLTSVIATSLNLPRSRWEEALASICFDMRCGCLIAFSFTRAIKRQAFKEDGEYLSVTLSCLSESLS